MVSEWHTIFHSLSFMVLFGEIFFFSLSLFSFPTSLPMWAEPEHQSSRPEVISSVLITTRLCRNSQRCFLRSLDNCWNEVVSVVAHVASNSRRIKRTPRPPLILRDVMWTYRMQVSYRHGFLHRQAPARIHPSPEPSVQIHRFYLWRVAFGV